MSQTEERTDVDFGQTVYDDDNPLGTVRGFDEHGFYVVTADGVAALSSEYTTAGTTGQAELMWRCWECGEIGDVAEVPDAGPSCGAPREDIYYWTED